MLKTSHHLIHLETRGSLQFIDLTDRVAEIVKESGICQGLVNIQTRHTTTAIVINEHEPLLLEVDHARERTVSVMVMGE
jgi:thiamine phosphate synthase YjbQ (UPF0047 family)